MKKSSDSRAAGRPGASAAFLFCLLPLAGFIAAPVRAAISSPLEIPGHVLWLDAGDFNGDGAADTGESGTPATVWVDKSDGMGVNSVTVTAGEPTLEYGVEGARNAMRFIGGSQDKMDNEEFVLEENYTVFTIVHYTDFGGPGHVLSGINGEGTDTVLYRANTGSYRIYSGVDSGGTDVGIAGAPGDIGPALFGYQVSADGPDRGFFQNFESEFELNGPATLNGLRIGNLDRGTPSDVGQSEAFSGDIFEVILYNRVLTAQEITDVRSYLKTKYALEFPEPTGAMTEIETGMVTGGEPSALDPESEPLKTGRTNIALATNGGLAFSQDYIGPGDPRDFRAYRINDGLYFDLTEGPPPIGEPWIGMEMNSFAGVKFPAAATIDRIGFENEFLSRRNGLLYFEYTRDDLSNVPEDADLGLDPFEMEEKTWTLIDFKNIQDGENTRHLYSFPAIEGVTAVRVRIESSAVQFAIAELEVWSNAGAPAAPKLSNPGIARDGDNIVMTFTRTLPSAGFTYTLEESDNTASGWTANAAAVFETTGQEAGAENVKVTLPFAGTARRFLRVRVAAVAGQ